MLDRLVSTDFVWTADVGLVGGRELGRKHFSHCKRLGCKGSEVV